MSFTYAAVAQINNDEITGIPVLASIQQNCNPVVDNMQNYNLYITDLNIMSSFLPLLNYRKNIIDFTNNRTNLCFSLMAPDGEYPFTYAGDQPEYYGINESGDTPGTYQGMGAYLVFSSQNNQGFPNPSSVGFTSSESYPLEYFDSFYVNQFVNMWNGAMAYINTRTTGAHGPLLQFVQNAGFNLIWETAAYNQDTVLYVNWALQRWLDGFVFQQNQYPYQPIATTNYSGLDWYLKFQPVDILQTTATSVIQSTEYDCSSNLIDTAAVLIACQGCLASCVPENIPSNNDATSFTLPSMTLLKYLPITQANVGLSNAQLVFEDDYLRRSITLTSSRPLTDIRFTFYFQDQSFNVRQLQVPSNKSVLVRFALQSV